MSLQVEMRRLAVRHDQQVTERPVVLAGAVRLSEAVTALEVAGSVHDVEKIGIRPEVLRKHGPLTPEE